MKKAILALLIVSSAHASPVEDMIASNVNDTLRQLEINRNPPPKVYSYPKFDCRLNVTVESTGKVRRNQFFPSYGEGVHFSDSGSQYIYHEEDNTGGSTLMVDKKTLRGDINITQADGQVELTGTGTCKKVS